MGDKIVWYWLVVTLSILIGATPVTFNKVYCWPIGFLELQRRWYLMRDVLRRFQNQFGEGTAFDLDYGKLVILGLLIYVAFFKDYGI